MRAAVIGLLSGNPISPECTDLHAQWLFRPETLDRHGFNPGEFASYAQMVLQQDAKAAEINQRGLRCIAHEAGSLMAEEYDVLAFQNWVRAQLARGSNSSHSD